MSAIKNGQLQSPTRAKIEKFKIKLKLLPHAHCIFFEASSIKMRTADFTIYDLKYTLYTLSRA